VCDCVADKNVDCDASALWRSESLRRIASSERLTSALRSAARSSARLMLIKVGGVSWGTGCSRRRRAGGTSGGFFGTVRGRRPCSARTAAAPAGASCRDFEIIIPLFL
jgi:hypothetical protein